VLLHEVIIKVRLANARSFIEAVYIASDLCLETYPTDRVLHGDILPNPRTVSISECIKLLTAFMPP
jgi:hypothetical protein